MTLSVFDAAREQPQRTALVIEGSSIAYAELAGRVERRVKALGDRLIRNEPIALLGRSDLPTLEVVYAAITLGVPLVLLHPRLTETEANQLVHASGVRRLEEPLPLPADGSAQLANRPEGPPLAEEQPLAMLFTSGTEGPPKAALLSRRAFLASATASALNLGWCEQDRWLLALPIAHVGGLSILVRCLLARRTVIVPTEVATGQRLSPAAIRRTLEADRITLLSLVPTQLHHFLEAYPNSSPPSCLRAVLLGGAPATPALLNRAADLGWPVLTSYGLTEACSQVATQPLGTVNRGSLGSGRVVHGTDLKIHNGLLYVRGPTLFSGYYPLGMTPSCFDADGWFCTGDHGHLDSNGFLHVLGRRTDVIITGGENVYPVEIETKLERMTGIEHACVFGVPDPTWGQLVAVALISKRPPSDAELSQYLTANLAKYKRPRRIAFVSEFMFNGAGKLDRPATAAHVAAELRPLRLSTN